ncbi:MAG TPA: universal stress protein [Terriglobales bacterium]|nr:universal stress protein [Terriglobales bacterium]
MTTLELEKSITFRNILLATDFSEASEHALQYAAAVTDLNHSQLFVLHAVPPEARGPVPLDPLPKSIDHDYSNARLNLDRAVFAEPLQHLRHEEILERGPVAEVVSNAIQENKIDLLVLGTHGRTGLKKLVMGSVAEELFRSAPCPVLTVGPSATRGTQIRKVLFATDFGPSSEHALPYAVDFANKAGGELLLLHLIPPVPVEYVGPFWYPGSDVIEREEASRRKFMEKLHDLVPSSSALDCKVEYRVECHFAPEGIIEVARRYEADLIVMGVRESGRNASRIAAHLPWAIAHDVVCYAACPVLTVRA